MTYIFYTFLLLLLGGVASALASLRVVSEGNEALVERLGQFSRKLEPGLRFVLPILETIVVEETTREKVLNIEPQNAITKDSVSLKVDAVVYWQVVDLERTFYVVEDIKAAIENLVLTTLRSEIGKLNLQETYSSRDQINRGLLQQLDEATGNWGVKVTRIEVREITPARTVMESLELQRAAESRKKADIAETEGLVESIKMIYGALEQSYQNQSPQARATSIQINMQEVLKFLVAQRYVDASEKVASSPSAKVVFMDPQMLNEAIAKLLEQNHHS